MAVGTFAAVVVGPAVVVVVGAAVVVVVGAAVVVGPAVVVVGAGVGGMPHWTHLEPVPTEAVLAVAPEQSLVVYTETDTSAAAAAKQMARITFIV